MSTSISPQPVVPKAGGYQQEPNTFAVVNDAYRYLQSGRLRMSKNSPPVLNKDVTEGQIIYDKTLNRLYLVADGTLRYVQFT